MKTQLKVCGMRDVGNILEVAELSPAYMGFIFYKNSPRYVGNDFCIPVDFPEGVKRVGVFVDECIEVMLTISKKYNLDFLQLHGSESVEVCENLKASELGVIKVFRVDDQFNFESVRAYQQAADFFLFDTRGKNYGGNAVRFNWNLLNKYDLQVPFFLSGGITPDNVPEISALRGLNLHAVDVNSGVETAPGLKDIKRVHEVMNTLKNNML